MTTKAYSNYLSNSTYTLLRKKFIFKSLSLEDSTFYKGLAILIIIFHNFFHLLNPGIGENEQGFDIQRAERFWHIVTNQTEYFVQALFSFWGHYGVQIFLFLSAYGLTKNIFNLI